MKHEDFSNHVLTFFLGNKIITGMKSSGKTTCSNGIFQRPWDFPAKKGIHLPAGDSQFSDSEHKVSPNPLAHHVFM